MGRRRNWEGRGGLRAWKGERRKGGKKRGEEEMRGTG